MGADQVAPAEEGTFQTVPEPLQLDPILCEEAAEVRRVGRAELGDLRFEPCHVRRAVEVSARSEGDAVLRVEPDHRYFGVQVSTDQFEDAFEDERIEEESRPQVEAKAGGLDRRAPAADARLSLDDLNLNPGANKEER